MSLIKDPMQADANALNEFIVNCPELERLESLLGGFNLFQVLKFEYGEIRHSNVLGWILDPTESHGLGATFLQKWLKRVIYKQHRRALDVIFDHRPDNLQSVSADLQGLFQENAQSLGIVMGPCDKFWNHVHRFDIESTSLAEDAPEDPAEVARKIYDSCVLSLKRQQAKEVIAEITKRLPALDRLMKAM